MDLDDESIARCHAGAVVDAEGAFRDLIYHMHRHRSVNVFKAAMVDVVVRAVTGLTLRRTGKGILQCFPTRQVTLPFGMPIKKFCTRKNFRLQNLHRWVCEIVRIKYTLISHRKQVSQERPRRLHLRIADRKKEAIKVAGALREEGCRNRAFEGTSPAVAAKAIE